MKDLCLWGGSGVSVCMYVCVCVCVRACVCVCVRACVGVGAFCLLKGMKYGFNVINKVIGF